MTAERSLVANSGKMFFKSNTAYKNGGGLHLYTNTTLWNSGFIEFSNNTALYGDGSAVSIDLNSFLHLKTGTRLRFCNNTASFGKGALFVYDVVSTLYCAKYYIIPNYKQYYFFQVPNDLTDMQMYFEGNQAVAGADVYGGFNDWCYTNNSLNSISTVLFNSITNSTHPLQISATPYQVCPCIDGTMDCSLHTVAFQVLPGQKFNISVVATGQRNGVVPTNIVVSIDDSNSYFQSHNNKKIYAVTSECTELNVILFSINKHD